MRWCTYNTIRLWNQTIPKNSKRTKRRSSYARTRNDLMNDLLYVITSDDIGCLIAKTILCQSWITCYLPGFDLPAGKLQGTDKSVNFELPTKSENCFGILFLLRLPNLNSGNTYVMNGIGDCAKHNHKSFKVYGNSRSYVYINPERSRYKIVITACELWS